MKQGRDITAYEYCSFHTINYISSQPLKLKVRIGIVLAGLAYEVTQRGRTWGPGILRLPFDQIEAAILGPQSWTIVGV
jgi:hypothetical protein